MKMLFYAVFINNIVLLSFFGLEWIQDTTAKSKNAFGIIISTILVVIVSSFANFWVYDNVIKVYNIEILTLILFSFNSLLSAAFISWILPHCFKILYDEIKEFINVAAISSLVLGVSILNIDKKISVSDYMYINFCNALGFALIVVLLTAIRERISATTRLSKNVEGGGIIFIILGLISMAFMGFSGAAAHL